MGIFFGMGVHFRGQIYPHYRVLQCAQRRRYRSGSHSHLSGAKLRVPSGFAPAGLETPGKRWYGEWQFSVYTAYNRATPVAIDLTFDEEQNTYRYEQPGLFGLLPSVSYHFKFK